jgi:predicted  nucleic acid-binding Zn-ribbon protein
MFKNIISPVQAWLLSQGRCVGCGISIQKGKKSKLSDKEEEVTCKKCGRVYILNLETRRFKRAPLPVPS